MNSKDDIEMKEIKASKGKALLKFLDKHLCGVYLLVGIVLSLFSCEAKAESIPPSAREYFDEVVQQGIGSIPSADLQSFNDYVNTCFQQQYIYNFKMSYYSTVYEIFVFTPSSSFGTYGKYGKAFSSRSMYAYTTINDFPTYTIMIQPNGIECYTSTEIQYGAFSDSWNSVHWTRYHSRNTYSTVYQWGTRFSMGTTSNGNPYGYKSNSDYVAQIIYSRSTDYDYSASWQTVEKFPTYTEDSRLKFALINDSYEGEVLMTDIRQFMADFTIQDTSHSSAFLDPESIILKYTVDGTEKTITLDSNNSTIRSKYIFETPTYQFDFDDDNTSVIITSADFTISGTSQSAPFEASETYRIATNYPIRRLSPLPIPTPIADPTYNDVTTDVSDPATVLQEITTQLTNDSTTTNAFTGEWTLDQEHPTVPSWADSYDFRVIKSDFNSIISGVVNQDVWNYYTSNDPNDYDWITGGFNPRNFVDENRNFAFYDMIIISVYEANIAWDPDNVGTNLIYQNIHLLGYITLYSQRYYVHKSAITDSNILATLEFSSMNDVAFYETIKATVDQFEEYTLGRFDASLDIEKDSLSWLKTIDNSIKSLEPFDDSSILGVLDNIYNAITGIGTTDTSRIETKLDTLINHFLANNSQENSAYKQFVTWLRDVNGKPVQYVTTGFDFFTELFDYFPFTRDLDGSGGFANMFDMGKGFIDLSTGHTTGIPENYQDLSYYFNSANDGTYNVQSMSGR